MSSKMMNEHSLSEVIEKSNVSTDKVSDVHSGAPSVEVSVPGSSVTNSSSSGSQKNQNAVQKISTTEMLNVMDIVDQMRHQEDYLQKHYDSLLSNDVLKEQLRTVYAQHSIVVDESTLIQAVQTYREKQFVLPLVSDGWKKSLAKLYVTRQKWQRKFSLSLVGALVALSALGVGYVSYEAYIETQKKIQLENVKNQRKDEVVNFGLKKEKLIADIKNLNSIMDSIMEQTLLLSNSDKARWSSAYVESGINEQKNILKSHEIALMSTVLNGGNEEYLNWVDSAMSVEQLENNKVFELVKKVGEHQKEVEQIGGKVAMLSSLFSTENLWNNLEKSAGVKFKEGAQWKGATVKMQAYLSSGNLALAEETLEQTKNSLVNETKWLSLDQRMEVAQNKSKKFDEHARELMNSQFNVAQSLREKGDVSRYEALVAEIEKQVDEASLDLTFTIVARQGVRSGVERTANISKTAAKKYYVIVEALDAMGVAQNVRVKNIETGEHQAVKMFGVEVSKDVYEQVKRDKMDDGIIQNSIVAKKAAGSLTWKVGGEFEVMGGRITKW